MIFLSWSLGSVLWFRDLDRIFDHFSYLLLGDNHVEEIAKLAMVIVQSTMY